MSIESRDKLKQFLIDELQLQTNCDITSHVDQIINNSLRQPKTSMCKVILANALDHYSAFKILRKQFLNMCQDLLTNGQAVPIYSSYRGASIELVVSFSVELMFKSLLAYNFQKEKRTENEAKNKIRKLGHDLERFYLELSEQQQLELVTAYSTISGVVFTKELLKSEINKIKLNFQTNRYGYEEYHTLYRYNSFDKLAQSLLTIINRYIQIEQEYRLTEIVSTSLSTT